MANEIRVPIEVVTKKALDAVRKFSSQIQSNLGKGFSNASRSVDKFTSSVGKGVDEYEKLNEQNAKFVQGAETVATRAGLAFAALSASITGAVLAASSFEDISVQFEVLTGSAEGAADAVNQLKDFSAGTPFQFADIAAAGKQLLGFGFQTEELTKNLTNIGNVAAASGKNIQEISLIFGQVSAAGKLTGERLLQFQERAIPIGPAIAKTLGVAETAVKDLVSKGVVDFKTFETAFASLSQEGGFAFGGLEKLSKTLSGVLSTLGDNFKLLVADIGNEFLPVFKAAGAALIEFIQIIRGNPDIARLGAIFLGVSTVIAGLTTALALGAIAFAKISAALAAAKVAAIAFGGSIAGALVPIAILTAKITLIIGAVVALGKAISFIEEETEIFSATFSALGEIFNAFAPVLSATSSIFEGFGEVIARAARQIGGLFVAALLKALDAASALAEANPFGIFSDEAVGNIRVARDRLQSLSKDISRVGFDLGKLQSSSEKVSRVPFFSPSFAQNGKRTIDTFTDVGDALFEANENYVGLAASAKMTEETLKKSTNLSTSGLEKAGRNVASLGKGLDNTSKSFKNLEKTASDVSERIGSRLSTLASSISQALGQAGQGAGQALGFAFGTGGDRQRKELDQLEEDLKEAFEAGKLPEDAFKAKQSQLNELRDDLSRNTALAIGTGIANSFAKGAQGAKDLVVAVGGLALDAILPGLGQALGPLLGTLAKGPDEVRKLVNEFADALPIIVENLILSIPVFFEAIADKVDVIVERLAEKADDIIIALVKATPRVAFALANALAFQVPLELAKTLPQALINIFQGVAGNLINILLVPFRAIANLFSNIPQLFAQAGQFLFDSIINAGQSFVGEILSGAGRFIEELLSKIPIVGGLFGGGSGGGPLGAVTGAVGGVVDAVGDVFGFQDGGTPVVRRVPGGFPNDSFPARLQSRELIVDSSTADGLRNFLQTQNQGEQVAQLQQTNSLLGELVTMMAQGQQVSTQVEFREGVLADIILDLNRSNARLS